MSKQIGYIRVSSFDQNPDRQLEALQLDKVFTDKASGKEAHRPQLQALLDYVRDGHHVFVHSMDRLAKNLEDLRSIVTQLNSKQVPIHFLKENLCFNGDDAPLSTLLLSIMGAFAEFERQLTRSGKDKESNWLKSAGFIKAENKCFQMSSAWPCNKG